MQVYNDIREKNKVDSDQKLGIFYLWQPDSYVGTVNPCVSGVGDQLDWSQDIMMEKGT